MVAHLGLAFTYSALGQEAEARAAAAEVLRLQPTFSLEALRGVAPFKNPADSERFLTVLRKVGLK